MESTHLFSLVGLHAVVGGGAGVLGRAIARGLGMAGARVSIADLRRAETVAAALTKEGYDAAGYTMDAIGIAACKSCAVLVSAAGGNHPPATTGQDQSFFDLPLTALERVAALNLFGGAIIPTQVFARGMAQHPDGGSSIIITTI